MNQLQRISEITHGIGVTYNNNKNLNKRLFGQFYTPELIANNLIIDIISHLINNSKNKLSIIDPFCGDGRLVLWLINKIHECKINKEIEFNITLWDCDKDALDNAISNFELIKSNESITVNALQTNSFETANQIKETFDICITNPPWETIKPDHREISLLDESHKLEYIDLLKNKIRYLEINFPHSKPTKNFSGWGFNLSRCGIEAAIRLTSDNGIFGIVAPSTVFGDQVSSPLRKWIFTSNQIDTIRHYPAEAKLFSDVDQNVITFCGIKNSSKTKTINIHMHPKNFIEKEDSIKLEDHVLAQRDYIIGFSNNQETENILLKIFKFPQLSSFEVNNGGFIKFGRELDETGVNSKLSKKGNYLFIKGKMVGRYKIIENPSLFIKSSEKIPNTVERTKLVWRDVARQSSKRRLQATIIQPGIVSGNSLNIATVIDDNHNKLKALLAFFNSSIFELQSRTLVNTNHLSVGSIRNFHIPELSNNLMVTKLAKMVEKYINNYDIKQLAKIEAFIGELYGLNKMEYEVLLNSLPNIDLEEKILILDSFKNNNIKLKSNIDIIPNHFASSLSKLDVDICKSVPPGGNWKNIPDDIPSQRIQNIRRDYNDGKGSRSTYYGRLHSDKPSYTINTYFTRPGNGCHIHYDFSGNQHRTLSHREAARLQSFPDDFIFLGTKSSIENQIGNAVPPLLSFQIAKHIKFKGEYLDLFSGAGGLSLGFKWAGWKPLLANDIDNSFLETYKINIHNSIVPGDIRESRVLEEITSKVSQLHNSNKPLFILGGPPCQGFSTAGNKRSNDDKRNWLFKQYIAALNIIKPDGFVFENVTGILNMDNGKFFKMITSELHSTVKKLYIWKLNCESYGIPQRRTRVVIIGDNTGKINGEIPTPITKYGHDLFNCQLPFVPSVKDALSDLPFLEPGEDGSNKKYKHEPRTLYQKLMRGLISSNDYLSFIQNLHQ